MSKAEDGARPAEQALVNEAPKGSSPPSGFDPSRWRTDVENAPQDRPILAWCRDDCQSLTCGLHTGEGATLCLYHAHAEGLCAVGDGPAVIEWGGSWDDSTWEYSGGWMPDWWFRTGSEFEEAANPIAWMEIEPPALGMSAGTEKTPQAAEGEARQPDPEGETPNQGIGND